MGTPEKIIPLNNPEEKDKKEKKKRKFKIIHPERGAFTRYASSPKEAAIDVATTEFNLKKGKDILDFVELCTIFEKKEDTSKEPKDEELVIDEANIDKFREAIKLLDDGPIKDRMQNILKRAEEKLAKSPDLFLNK